MAMQKKWLVMYVDGLAEHWDTDKGAPSAHWYLGYDVDDRMAELEAQIAAERKLSLDIALLYQQETNFKHTIRQIKKMAQAKANEGEQCKSN